MVSFIFSTQSIPVSNCTGATVQVIVCPKKQYSSALTGAIQKERFLISEESLLCMMLIFNVVVLMAPMCDNNM